MEQLKMKLSQQPVWLVGFRPFFILAIISGILLPTLWLLQLHNLFSIQTTPFSVLKWHAHEMFYGFGWAVLGGFLLTSTKNWMHIRGYHGKYLIYLSTAWLVDRIASSFGASWPPSVLLICHNLFLVSIISFLLWTLIRHKENDTYKDNIFFIVMLPFFILANNLMIHPEFYILGISMTLGLFRLAFLLMLERTLTQFMKNIFQLEILRNPRLDNSIKGLALILIFQNLFQPQISLILLSALALLLIIRFAFWKPLSTIKRLDISVMYLGYLGIVAQLLVEISGLTTHSQWIGAFSIHVFTFGVMGLIIPSMLIRLSKGHTGRKVIFDAIDLLTIKIMISAFIFRVIMAQVAPSMYLLWILLSGICWISGFLIIGIRYIPFLLQPRVDGKEH